MITIIWPRPTRSQSSWSKSTPAGRSLGLPAGISPAFFGFSYPESIALSMCLLFSPGCTAWKQKILASIHHPYLVA
jgi:hypothetical protein